ncbi:MAG TPA: hypothetical protein ENK18_13720 [Deltaproteobacteria bacterium]|nr:hypothetical protein [Deltaproteobacteria bacterium]
MRAIPFLVALFTPLPALASGASDTLAEIRAEELPEIAETGISAFDSVFMKAAAIHDTLNAVQDRILGAEDRIAEALELEPGTPLRMSMWELKQRAGGPIEVALEGTKPVLTVGGSGADDVEALLDAINLAVADLVGIPGDLAQLPAQIQELVAACQAFPGQLNPQLLTESGLKPLELPKVAKTVGSNVKAVVATPKRLEDLVNASKDFLTGIPQGLAATEPPEEPAQIAGGSSSKPAKQKKSKRSGGTSELEGSDNLSPITAMVVEAMASFQDAEVESAMGLLARADASLANLTGPVSEAELQNLYQSSALVYLSGGNLAAASANVAQALTVDPEAKPMPHLGPDYAKLHKHLAKSGVIHPIEIPVEGNGIAYVSGTRVEEQGWLELPPGKHLVQIKQPDGGWTSEVVWINEGYVLKTTP